MTTRPSIESLRDRTRAFMADLPVYDQDEDAFEAFVNGVITELSELREAVDALGEQEDRDVAAIHRLASALERSNANLTAERARADALEAIGRRLSEIFHHEHRSVTILEMDALDKALGITPKEVRDKYPDRWCTHDARIRREALEEAWSRLGSANDPLSPGYYVCNSIEVSRWAALEEAMFTATTRDEAGGER